MLWVVLAILAHVANAFVFVVDKSLLSGGGKISQPVRYTFYSGVLAGMAVLLLPFNFVPPTMFVIGWSAVAGLFHLAALWLFFRILKFEEPSRVVPIVGSAVPLFTLVFAVTALGEQLILQQLLAVALLIVGGAVLSMRWRTTVGVSAISLLTILASGALFAGYFATVKYLYASAGPFLPVFAYSRLVEAVLALIVLSPFVLRVKGGSTSQALPRSLKNRSALKGGVFVANKALAAGAFLLQGYAISLGSVTVVNAMQGVQYVFLLLLAAAVSWWWPILFREELNRVVWGQKIAGVALVVAGLVFLF